MKICAVLVSVCAVIASGASMAPAAQSDDTITISGAWALYPMAVRWAEEFRKVNPKARIDISAGGAGKGIADVLAGVVDIGMVSRRLNPVEAQKGAWHVAVAKDAVIPTVNEKNPLVDKLLLKGVSPTDCAGIWITGRIAKWSDLVPGGPISPVHVYTRSDACGAAQTWAEFLGKAQEDLLGIGVYGDPGLTEAVRKDILGIGFNNVNYAYDGRTKLPVKGIKVLPLDVNGNGKIDADEDFYRNRDDLMKAIGEGRYPSPPARELYFVCKGRPGREIVRTFLEWVLTSGQKYVQEAGYVPLGSARISEGLRSLKGN